MSILVLNYNGIDLLEVCLDSILAQDYESFEVVFIDNASSDGSAAFVRERYPSVRVLENAANLGFAEGNNVGFRATSNELVVLVNNDVKVEPGWLAELVKAVEPEGVAAAESLIITEGIPNRYYYRNGTINFMGRNIMLAFDDPSDTFACSGCSVIFKRSLVGEPYDGDYFAYSEDMYFGFRIRAMGLRQVHTNASRLYHFGGQTAGKIKSSFICFVQERNRLLNLELFLSTWTRFRLLPFYALNMLVKLGVGLVSKRYSFSGFLRAYVWLVMNRSLIHAKRRALLAERKVPESDLIAVLSGKVTNGEGHFGKLANFLSLGYCRVVGLRVIEVTPKQFRGEVPSEDKEIFSKT